MKAVKKLSLVLALTVFAMMFSLYALATDADSAPDPAPSEEPSSAAPGDIGTPGIEEPGEEEETPDVVSGSFKWLVEGFDWGPECLK